MQPGLLQPATLVRVSDDAVMTIRATARSAGCSPQRAAAVVTGGKGTGGS